MNPIRRARRWGLACAWALPAIAALGCASGRSADDLPPPVAREFRGVWVATVMNIDWPRGDARGPTAGHVAAQRSAMAAQLDLAKRLNLNAVILQVRPSCDAIYPSTLEPWSEFLTGTAGQPPDESWDPLAEWTAGAHQRGLELHAWFNPFRARHAGASSPIPPGHIASQRPDLVREYAGALWLDPGEPEAREHSLAVIEDVVRKYPVDGVHLDDYFYPYPKDGTPFPDDEPFNRYRAAGGVLDLPAWRRMNIDGFVHDLYTRVKRTRPEAVVGISPFGIWRPDHPKGVRGFDAVEGLHADALAWVNNGWVDYLAPQLYWPIGSPGQPYPDLLSWWVAQTPDNTGLFAGLIPSRIDDTQRSYEPVEIVNQIVRMRGTPGTDGVVLFSMVALEQDRKGIATRLREGVFAEPALTPSMAERTVESYGPEGPAWPRASRMIQTALRWSGEFLVLDWEPPQVYCVTPVRGWILHTRYGSTWNIRVFGPDEREATIPKSSPRGTLSAMALSVIDRRGVIGSQTLWNRDGLERAERGYLPRGKQSTRTFEGTH